MSSPRLAVLIVLVTVGSVMAQSVVEYELGLGGDNQVELWESTGFPPPNPRFLPGASDDGEPFVQGEVLTWSAMVQVSGIHQGDVGGGYETNGAANLVFSLELHEATCDGPLVNHDVFFSTMNDGDAGLWGTDPLEMAAFAHSFDVLGSGPPDGAGPGRIFDRPQEGGPYLDLAQYPSTASHAGGYRYGATYTPGSGPTTLPPGVLVGMGAGYTMFSPWEIGGLNVAGVGLEPAQGPFCYRGLGHVPVFEGQIDTTSLPMGNYCLKLLPEAGNNVLRGDFDCTGEEPWSFAVSANQVVGDTIEFFLGPDPCPAIVSWESVRYHGPVGAGVPLGLTLEPGATGNQATVEPRRFEAPGKESMDWIVVRFDGDINAYYVPGQVAIRFDAPYGGLITVAGESLGGATNNELWIELTFAGFPVAEEAACLEVDIGNGVMCLLSDTDCQVRMHEGNVSGFVGGVQDTWTNLIDYAEVKGANAYTVVDPGHPLYDPGKDLFDWNLDGVINLIDAAGVKERSGLILDCDAF